MARFVGRARPGTYPCAPSWAQGRYSVGARCGRRGTYSAQDEDTRCGLTRIWVLGGPGSAGVDRTGLRVSDLAPESQVEVSGGQGARIPPGVMRRYLMVQDLYSVRYRSTAPKTHSLAGRAGLPSAPTTHLHPPSTISVPTSPTLVLATRDSPASAFSHLPLPPSLSRPVASFVPLQPQHRNATQRPPLAPYPTPTPPPPPPSPRITSACWLDGHHHLSRHASNATYSLS